MPVWLDSGPLGCRLFTTDQLVQRDVPVKLDDGHRVQIELGLINNMSDLALQQAERQILSLLHAASYDLAIRLKLYALPAVPRAELGRQHLGRLHYLLADDLLNSNLDGLIVTGAEPRTADLQQEPYWHELTNAFGWAEKNTISTITSCLAVHAAVLHFDGIERNSLDEKCFGILNFEKTSDHPFVQGIPRRFRMPHSRWNTIDQRALLASGYEILTSSPIDGVDTFVKSRKSLFVFFQGHPEYDAWTLLGEYRRDIRRFLEGQRDTYPTMPRHCFDDDGAKQLEAFKDRAITQRHIELMANFPTALLSRKLSDPWRPIAVDVYANWLRWVAARKAERTRPISGSGKFATSKA